VEDWEQFFVDKSRRRFDKDRLDRRRRRLKSSLAVGVLGALLLFAIVALAMLI
jgi:hypothetical protein